MQSARNFRIECSKPEVAPVMSMYPVEQAVLAHKALREAAGLAPELFPLPAFVGMVSDEIEVLRGKGMSDQEIADIVRSHSAIEISADEIAEHYAPPENRRRG